MRRLVHYALLAALTLAACGGDDAVEERIIDPVEVDPPLVGTWTTTGTDEDFGAVDVIMELLRDGTLKMSVALDGGGQLKFPRRLDHSRRNAGVGRRVFPSRQPLRRSLADPRRRRTGAGRRKRA